MAREISLTKGYVALVDDSDYERVAQHLWHVSIFNGGKNIYATRAVRVDGRMVTIYLHRFILDAPKGTRVDHRDGNGLDCQRHNLRFATHAQNCCNRDGNPNSSSIFKGVRRVRSGNFVAQIGVERKVIYLGTFASPELAARAYDEAAQKLFGEFARLNFPVAS